MIRLFLAINRCCKNIKQINAHEFCQNLHRSAVKGAAKCPNGCKGRMFHKDGTYQRKIICYEKNEVVMYEITVNCLECRECGHTHAMLPSIVIPHSQFTIQFAVQIIQAYLVQRYHSVNEMCQSYGVSVATFYRLLHCFKRDWEKMRKLIQNYSEKMEELLMQFAEYSYAVMDERLQRFYHRYCYDFMYFHSMDST